MNTSRLVTGLLMIIIGLALTFLNLLVNIKPFFVFWIYGIPMFVIGIVILFNKKEDVIEQIKSEVKK